MLRNHVHQRLARDARDADHYIHNGFMHDVAGGACGVAASSLFGHLCVGHVGMLIEYVWVPSDLKRCNCYLLGLECMHQWTACTAMHLDLHLGCSLGLWFMRMLSGPTPDLW